MATRLDILATAAGQIGVVERGRNVVPYWPELGLPQGNTNGWAWCAAFVTWVYLRCGIDLRTHLGWPYYCPNIVNWAKGSGRWRTDGPQPGDLTLYSFTDGGVAAHIGIHEQPVGGAFHAVEGNTSPGNGGSQANGGGVWRRARSRGVILGWVDMSDLVDGTSLSAPGPGELVVDGSLGPLTIRRLQQVLGTSVDGVITRGGSQCVRSLQLRLNGAGVRVSHPVFGGPPRTLAVDGEGLGSNAARRRFGPTMTVAALQARLGTPVTGYLSAGDSLAVRALQRRLNDGTV